jgi:hypothetical protein
MCHERNGGNMEDKREKWIKPRLIVLGRGTPEENVLGGCKTSLLSGLGATIKACKRISGSRGQNCGGTKCSVISTTS